MKIVLPLPPNFSNARGHSRWSGSAKKRWIEGTKRTMGVSDLAKSQAGAVALPLPPVRCRVTFYVHQRMDRSNAVARLKWVEDALVRGQVIVNDTDQYWQLEGWPAQVIDRKHQRVELEIEVIA